MGTTYSFSQAPAMSSADGSASTASADARSRPRPGSPCRSDPPPTSGSANISPSDFNKPRTVEIKVPMERTRGAGGPYLQTLHPDFTQPDVAVSHIRTWMGVRACCCLCNCNCTRARERARLVAACRPAFARLCTPLPCEATQSSSRRAHEHPHRRFYCHRLPRWAARHQN